MSNLFVGSVTDGGDLESFGVFGIPVPDVEREIVVLAGRDGDD